MNSLKTYFDNLTMYRLMLYFLRLVVGLAVVFSIIGTFTSGESLFSWTQFSWISILVQVVLFVEICWGFNILLARLFKTKPNYESQIITGIILFLIMGPLSLPRDWAVLVVASSTAMLSKYLIVKNKSHIFNPAVFGAVVTALVLGHPASWWAGGQMVLPILMVGGLLVVHKIRRFHLVLSFLITYSILILLSSLVDGVNMASIPSSLKSLLTSPAIIFFMFVMLVEPLTSPQTTRRRIYFGIVVGTVLFLLQRFASNIMFSLELALLVGNIFARIINPDFRQAFVLKLKENLAPSIVSFWFEPARPIDFIPGQFLEYTLAHPDFDDRGVRRYFTIASSPTEKNILLTTRFSDKSSSFKKALKDMSMGDEVIASKVAGDFVLSADKTKKLVFVAGGIGITPFRSMIKYLLDSRERCDIILLYAAKVESDLVFREIFEEAHDKLGIKNVYVLSDEASIPANWSGHKGFVNADLIKEEVPDFKDRTFYVSGPEPMVQAIEKVLDGMGISKSQIVQDYFPGY